LLERPGSSGRGRTPAIGVVAVLLVVPLLVACVAAGGGTTDRARNTAAPHPRIVFRSPGDAAQPSRLSGATIAPRDVIGLTGETRVRRATYFVDESGAGGKTFAVDRSAPFVMPHKGRTGRHPYALGQHNLRIELELRSGREIRLAVSYKVARTLEVASNVDSATLQRSIGSVPAGPLLVRAAKGAPTFTVEGDLTIARTGLTLRGAQIRGIIDFEPGSDGSSLVDGSASGFGIFGADDITLEGNVFDGHGRIKDNQIWDQPAGQTPDRFRIVGNTFMNYYDDRTEDVHSQALYIGYATDGLVEGNSFTNNGSTAHIFLSYFGELADPARSIPRNICIRRNRFGPTHGGYDAVNLRREIPPTSGVDVARSNVVSGDVTLISDPRFLRDC
jgi:hypothetical protein